VPELSRSLQDQKLQPLPAQMPGGGQTGLPAAHDDDVEPLDRGGHEVAARSTVKLNIIPECMCSAM
jgi:hypothetical protein